MASESSGAEWLVWMLGGENERRQFRIFSAHRCFERLIKCVESFLHPLHEGVHTPTLQSFLDALVSEMVRRVRTERVRSKTINKVPQKMRLTDEQIEWFVTTLLPSVLYSVFSTTETSVSNIMRNLAFLAPQLVLPRCLDLVYPSFSTITKPHRLKQSLECIVEICVPLVRDCGTYTYHTYNVCKRDWTSSPAENPKKQKNMFLQSSIEDTQSRRDQLRIPLREHAIFLLDALIDAVDINDIDKLLLSLQTLETIFHLIPIVDCSQAVEMKEYSNLNDEEKRLCKLTARFPSIVQNFVNKVFKVITQLSSSAPSEFSPCVDSICDNSEIVMAGTEEIVMSASIQSAFHALFSNCSSNFVALIGDQTYTFITTSQFENVVATDAACSLIEESTYADPVRYFPVYVKFLLEKQKQYMTEDKRALKELDATTMWYAYLSQTIFSVSSDLLLKYREECIQMHRYSLSMICSNVYQGACWSLKHLLTQLIEIYPISDDDKQADLDLPLNISLPIRKWGASCAKDSIRIKWHIPTDEELHFAERLLKEFAYPEIKLLATPNKMDKFAIKRSLFIIDSLLSCVGNRLPDFDTQEIKLSETVVNINPVFISSMSPNLKTFSLNGENIREKVRATLHHLMVFLLSQPEDESKSLLLISSILQTLCTEGSVPQFRARRKNVSINYHDPIRGRRAELYDSFERRDLYIKYPKFTESHFKIMKDLILLGTNIFTVVRVTSQAVLNTLIAKFPNSKRLLVDDVLRHLDPNRNINHEEMKGALYILNKCGFLISNTITIRCKCWPAIAKLQISEKPSIISLLQYSLGTVSVRQWTIKNNVVRIFAYVPNIKFKYACGVRSDNLQILYDGTKLPVNEKTWNETIFISKPHWGAYQWPKSFENFTSTLRFQFMNTEFFRSSSYLFEFRKLMVSAPANKQTVLQRSVSELNEIERSVLEYIQDEQFLVFWHAILLKEKEDSTAFHPSEYRFVKVFYHYVMYICKYKFFKFNDSYIKRRAQTKVAATYCAGIIRGSRNWPFKELQTMWKWLKPVIIYQIEGLTTDTLTSWEMALKLCMKMTDVRKLHWLVETIFEIASKPTPTAWHRCVRMGIIYYVSTCSAWRTTELLNRAIQIANNLIPQAWLAPERDEIANMLTYPAVYGFANGDQNDIPKNFKLPKLEEIIKMFNSQVEDLMRLRKKQQTKKSIFSRRKSVPSTQSSRSTASKSSKSSLLTASRTTIQTVLKTDSIFVQGQLYIKTLMRFLNAYFLSCFTALSPPIIALFPLVTHLADEETANNDEAEVVMDVDLVVGSSNVLFQAWSGIYLCDEIAEQMLTTVEKKELFEDTNNKILPKRHGAVLALSAVIRAHPFTIPPIVFNMIPRYCQLVNLVAVIVSECKMKYLQMTVTETLRSFLRTHHDEMVESGEKYVIEKLLLPIQNFISPNYYV
ncbi:unnamed protein product [Thelazia callipaeda]|uniref:BLM10_mid domain-containing protein n=1 Tax=Thelazia callipaeda TaxID=103827 RepID=A0A0N5DA19_THECL|nr:unnamed protein product [Thelazia callipaeda]